MKWFKLREWLWLRPALKVIAVLMLLWAGQVVAQDSVKFGFSPWTTPELLQAWGKPIEASLERHTGMPFQISSSASLQKFLVAGISEQFDVMQCPMHLGLYLVRYHGFRVALFARAKLRMLVVTRKNAGIDRLSQLKNTKMAVTSPIAISTLMADEAMGKHVFHARLVREKDHWQAIEALQKGRVQSATVIDYLYLGLSAPLKNKLKVLHYYPTALDGLVVTPESRGEDWRKKVASSLIDFKPHKTSLISGFGSAEEGELKEWFEKMNVYVESVNRFMDKKYFSKKTL
ncbi:MAG: PhnD/SsuA/transferrin family substrate-binding protein [Bermanella sp.]